MDPIDINSYVERYNERLKTFGYDPRTLGWGENGRQEVRFSILTEEIFAKGDLNCSILDVGCGFGDLFGFLRSKGWNGRYMGVDIVPELIETGKQIFPEADLRVMDILNTDEELKFDHVFASGIFNHKLANEANSGFIKEMISRFYQISEKYVGVDFMSTLVDFQKEGAWHTDPSWMLAEGAKLSKKLKLHHDYMPFEFTIFIYKDQERSKRNVFASYEDKLSAI